MATQMEPTPNLFQIKIEINRLFDQLIDRVNKRREQLLSQVGTFFSDYETYRNQSIGETETVRTTEGYANFLIEDMPIEELTNEQTKPLPKYLLTCRLEEIEKYISELGEIERISYKPPVPPKRSLSIQSHKPLQLGGRGTSKGQFDKPRGIGISDKDIIVIADQGRQVVSVQTLNGNILVEFKQDSPYGVCVYGDSVYVTDLKRDCVYLYSITRKILERSSKDKVMVSPKGLDFDAYTGTLYIADSYKHSIIQMSSRLEYLGEFGSDGKLCRPQDVKIEPKNGSVCVLDQGEDGIVHLFNRDGRKIRTVSGIRKPHVISSSFFCLDQNGNFVISDTERHTITVFSSEGVISRILGQEGERVGDLKYPRGVCCRQGDNKFLCASSNESFTVQMF